MKNLLRLEETAMLGFSIFSMILLHADWWWWLLLAVGPDISLAGYTLGNKTGAACYNFFHHKAIAILVFVLGFWLKNNALQLTGIALFGHSSMDRTLGYGLKLKDGFKFTHLGIIGRN